MKLLLHLLPCFLSVSTVAAFCSKKPSFLVQQHHQQQQQPRVNSHLVVTAAAASSLVEEFDVDDLTVKVFDGDYSDAIVNVVVETAKEAIASKGSFSLAIPGGSVVKALSGLSPDAFDMNKVHIYFCNERIGANKCYSGALESFVEKCNVPLEQVHKVPEGDPDAVAAQYEAMLRADASLDQSGPIPAVDLMLLGTGEDGHCGSLYPQSNEIKATGQGKVVLPIDEGDKKSIAVSMDFMCAAKKVLVSAAGAGRADMVLRALTGDFPDWDCPAGLVSAAEETIWMVDTNSIALFNEASLEEVDEDDEEEEESTLFLS